MRNQITYKYNKVLINMNKVDSFYHQKIQEYYGNVRYEVFDMLPDYADRVFEVGCGAGDTLSALKSSGRCNWSGGIEYFQDAARLAKEKVDFVFEGNIENTDLPLEQNSLDVILCLDVLEHLIDPWSVVHYLHTMLRPGGILICSIPNVRNFRVVLPLLLFGEWKYSQEGILDKTHLRFFTKKSAMELAECSGLHIDMVRATGLDKLSKSRIANQLTLSIFKPLFEVQYLIRAIKNDNKRL